MGRISMLDLGIVLVVRTAWVAAKHYTSVINFEASKVDFVGFLRCKEFIVESSLTTLIRTIMVPLLLQFSDLVFPKRVYRLLQSP